MTAEEVDGGRASAKALTSAAHAGNPQARTLVHGEAPRSTFAYQIGNIDTDQVEYLGDEYYE